MWLQPPCTVQATLAEPSTEFPVLLHRLEALVHAAMVGLSVGPHNTTQSTAPRSPTHQCSPRDRAATRVAGARRQTCRRVRIHITASQKKMQRCSSTQALLVAGGGQGAGQSVAKARQKHGVLPVDQRKSGMGGLGSRSCWRLASPAACPATAGASPGVEFLCTPLHEEKSPSGEHVDRPTDGWTAEISPDRQTGKRAVNLVNLHARMQGWTGFTARS
jgi:hypothetical protein